MSIYDLAKKSVLEIERYRPGKPIDELERELGLKDIIKMASNENPLGPSKKALKAMSQALKSVNQYPDGGAYYLKQSLSKKSGVDPKNMIIGNGSSEIVEMVAQAFMQEGDEAITCWPTFLMYSIITKIAQGRIVNVPLKDFKFDLEAIRGALSDKTKIIFISNPNNPTGTYVNGAELDGFIRDLRDDIVVIIDEAYWEFVRAGDFPDSVKYIDQRDNVIVVRTFSKIAGMAGIRIGYGFANEDFIDVLDRVRPPFNVNNVAQAGAAAAIEDEDHIAKTVEMVSSGREYLYEKFVKMKLEYIKSESNFILVKVGQGKAVFDSLLNDGVIVRAMDSFDLPDYIRVTVGTGRQNSRFVKMLKQVLKSLK